MFIILIEMKNENENEKMPESFVCFKNSQTLKQKKKSKISKKKH